MPEKETAEFADVLRFYGLEGDQVASVVKSICADKKRCVDFMMRFELGLEDPDPKRASRSALTIVGSYVAGRLVPLAPYVYFRSVHTALIGSVVVTLLALLVFGYIKGHVYNCSALPQCLADGRRGRTCSDRCVRDCESDGLEDESEEKPLQFEKGTSHGDKSRSLD
jgi:VIT1/CCC1 family predicted Fe2+/Mn2+ transporter